MKDTMEIKGTFLDAANDSGATLVECAVVFPFFLLLVFGIFDLSSVVIQHVMLADALKVAGRAGAISNYSSRSECETHVQRVFQDQMHRVGMANLATSQLQVSKQAVSAGGAEPVNGLNVDLRATVDCAVCSMLMPGSKNPINFAINFSAESFYPLEDQSKCS